MNNKALLSIYSFMCFWNLIILLFLSGIMIHASYFICARGNAREFLNQVSVMPNSLWGSALLAISSYLVLIAVLFCKQIRPQKRSNVRLLICAAEVVLAVIVFMALNMSYNGVLLLVIVDLVTEIQDQKKRLVLLAASLILYIFADYNLISLKIRMVSFQQYLIYYTASLQNLLLGIRSVLTSINFIQFVLCILILIRFQQQETTRIRTLNEQLNSANDQLKQMNVRLRDYAINAEKITEIRERNRLAREIHDTIGHALTGITAGIDACIAMIDVSPENTKQQLARISDVARQGITDVRRSVNQLRPDVLESLPLEEALRKMIWEISTATQTEILFDNHFGPLKFSPDEEDAVYRVIQEGITNSIRHGKATQIFITITRKEKWLMLTVHDTGIGCKTIKKGFGLQHILERVDLLGGEVSYDGSDGFTVVAKIPIRWGEEV
jgi:Signal transduction histidine kinase